MGNNQPGEASAQTIAESAYALYRDKLLPVEERHAWRKFTSPVGRELTMEDFSAKPMVLVIGPYSTGKTSFVKHLLQREYPGINIGVEPTTDKFTIMVDGDQESVIPGHTLVADSSSSFTQLAQFGESFLRRVQCTKLPSEPPKPRILKDLTLVDTPGVLSGSKQTLARGYDFQSVVGWFADRASMILLLFDVTKVDMSDEMKDIITALSKHDSKIYIILNKADTVDLTQLVRVYGALLWSLRASIETPEVPRVYIGSWWDEPIKQEDMRVLIEQDRKALSSTLLTLARDAGARKLNDLIRRAKLAQAHAYVLDRLRQGMPSCCGKQAAQQRMIKNLPAILQDVAADKHLPEGDFPSGAELAKKLETLDFTAFERVDRRKMEGLAEMLHKDIPDLIQNQLPQELAKDVQRERWLQMPDLAKYRLDFSRLEPDPEEMTVSNEQVRQKLLEANIEPDVVEEILALSDIDEDGKHDLQEYAIAMNFVYMKRDGHDLPKRVPEKMRVKRSRSAMLEAASSSQRLKSTTCCMAWCSAG